MEEKRAAHMESAQTLAKEGRSEEARQEALKAAELDPAFAEAQMFIARSYMEEEDFAKAEPHFAKALELTPDSLEALENLARIALVNDKLEAAEEYAQKAEALGDLSVDLQISRAGILMKRERYAEAVTVLEKIAAADPANEEAVIGLASAYLNLGEKAKAEEVLAAARNNIPGSTAAVTLLLSVAMQDKQYDKAAEHLTTLIEMDPEEQQYVLRLAELEILRGTPEKAPDVLRARLEKRPADTGVRMQLSQILAAQGKDNEAIETLQQAPEQNGEIRLATAALLARLHRTDEAEALLRNIAEDAGAPELADEAFFGLAELLLQQNKLTEAEQQLSAALDKNPTKLEARLMRGRVYFAQRRFAESIADLEAVLNAAPDNAHAALSLADSYNAANDPVKAEELITGVTTKHPQNIQAHLTLANFYLMRRMPDAAVMALRIGKNSNPDNIDLIMAEADTLGKLKRYSEAKAILSDLSKHEEHSEIAMARLAGIHGEAGEHSKAAAVYAKILETRPQAHYAAEGRVRALIAQNKSKEALTFAEKRFKANPKDPASAFLVAEASLAERNGPKAEKALLDALLLAPKWHQPLSILVQMYTVSNRLDEGLKSCAALLKSTPDAYGVMMLQGMLMEQKSRLTKAEEVYRVVLENNPDMIQAANNLASLLARHNPDSARLEEAEALARRASVSGAAATFDTLGWIQHLRGNNTEAERNLRTAYESYSTNPVVVYRLAAVLAALGEAGDKNKSAEAEILLEGLLNSKAQFPYRTAAEALYLSLKGAAGGNK